MAEEYTERASGLLVPSDLARETEVWTKDEVKLLNRVIRVMAEKGLNVLLVCMNRECRSEPLRLQIDRFNLRGEVPILRCAHKDRILDKGLK